MTVSPGRSEAAAGRDSESVEWRSAPAVRRTGGEPLCRVAPFRAALRRARALGRRLRVETWRLDGFERTSGEPLAVLFRGQRENKNYLKQLIYTGGCRETPHGVWCWRFEQLVRDAGAGHALAITERTQPPSAPPPGTFYIPCWIGGDIDFAAAARRCHTSDNLKADLRRVRKNGFDYTVERNRDAILRFYEEMYCPYVRAVYGGCAYVEPRADLEARLEGAELVLVRRNGQPVAGQVMRYEPGGVYGWLLGVKDADRRYVREGAIAAVYHFTMRHLMENGCGQIHAGESRPFLNDGVLRYKAKWGMRLAPGTPKWFALTLTRRSGGATAFLTNNPFIYEQAGRLYGAVFSDALARPSARELDALRIEGIAGVTLFRPTTRCGGLGGWNAAAFTPW